METLELEVGLVKEGHTVMLFDDILSKGTQLAAAKKVLRQSGASRMFYLRTAVLEICILAEIESYKGREYLAQDEVLLFRLRQD